MNDIRLKKKKRIKNKEITIHSCDNEEQLKIMYHEN